MLVALDIEPLYAHGFGERYDLPVPLWLYISGAGATVALSFAIIGFFVKAHTSVADYWHVNLLKWRLGVVLIHPGLLLPIKIVSVFLLGIVVVSGFVGIPVPRDNISPVLVWIIWWVGMAYISALIGNVWTVINPWKAVFEWTEVAWEGLFRNRRLSLNRQCPDQLGVWPAFLLFIGFGWVELVYAESAVPMRITQMTIIYSLITWFGMFYYGKNQWLRSGECFSVVFGLLAKFSPTEMRVRSSDGICKECTVDCINGNGYCVGCEDCFRRAPSALRELNVRPYATRLLNDKATSRSMLMLVLFLLATVTFDGFTATPLWATIVTFGYGIFPNLTILSTVGLLGFWLIFVSAYMGVIAMVIYASRSGLSLIEGAQAFIYSVIPIALAYHLAHFLSFLLIQGQLIIPLLSNPFGFGWDIFGTGDYQVKIGIMNARVTWLVSVGSIIIGHVIAIYLAHNVAIRISRDTKRALKSQYPMLGLMVGYTMVSLWILAQPIVEASTPR